MPQFYLRGHAANAFRAFLAAAIERRNIGSESRRVRPASPSNTYFADQKRFIG